LPPSSIRSTFACRQRRPLCPRREQQRCYLANLRDELRAAAFVIPYSWPMGQPIAVWMAWERPTRLLPAQD
jgi:hypothetical protein